MSDLVWRKEPPDKPTKVGEQTWWFRKRFYDDREPEISVGPIRKMDYGFSYPGGWISLHRETDLFAGPIPEPKEEAEE